MATKIKAPMQPMPLGATSRPCRQVHRGGAGLKTILGVAVLAAMIYASVKIVPVYFDEYQFQDTMQTTARFATINRQPPDEIRAALVKEAQKVDLPVQAEDIQVVNDAGNVRISANYSVTVDLSVYQLTLNFHPTASNNAL